MVGYMKLCQEWDETLKTAFFEEVSDTVFIGISGGLVLVVYILASIFLRTV